MHSKMEALEGIKEIAHNYHDKCKELKIELTCMKGQQVQIEADALEQKQKLDISGTTKYWKDHHIVVGLFVMH